jgi:hypothetical protein
MHDCDNPQWLFLRRVSNQVFVNDSEAQRTRGEVRASVALVRKRNKSTNTVQNCRNQTVGGIEIVIADEFSDLVKVEPSLRV